MDEDIVAYFEGKPDAYEIFKAVLARVRALGSFDVTVASQISLGVDRKFAWFWLYNITQKNPSGILHVMLRIDRRVDDPHVRHIEQVSKNRWNHQIVLRTPDDAQSRWLGDLLEAAFGFGRRATTMKT